MAKHTYTGPPLSVKSQVEGRWTGGEVAISEVDWILTPGEMACALVASPTMPPAAMDFCSEFYFSCAASQVLCRTLHLADLFCFLVCLAARA